MQTDNRKHIKINAKTTSLVKSFLIAIVLLFIMYILKISPVQVIRQYKNEIECLVSAFSVLILTDSVLNIKLGKSKTVQDLNKDINDTLNNMKEFKKYDINSTYIDTIMGKMIATLAVYSFIFLLLTMLIYYSHLSNVITLIILCMWLTFLIFVVWSLFSVNFTLVGIYLLDKHNREE